MDKKQAEIDAKIREAAPSGVTVMYWHKVNPEGELYWVAHCLEFDLVATARSFEEATTAFWKSVFVQIHLGVEHGDGPKEAMPDPSPDFMWWLLVDRARAAGIDLTNVDREKLVQAIEQYDLPEAP